MAFKIGANIALDGEKEFRAAVADMNGNLKVLQSEMKALTSTFGAEKKSVEQATAQQKNLTAQYDQQAEKVKQLEAALAGAVKNFGEGSKEARSWEIQLNNAKAALNTTGKELDKTNKELDQLKKQDTAVGKLKTAFHGLKEKVEEAEKKTEKLREAMSKIGDAAKAGIAAGTAAVAAIGTAAVAAGKKVYNMAQDVAAAGDAIDKGSQKLGVSAEYYQKLSYAAELSGTSIDVFATAQKKLLSSGSELNLEQAISQVAAYGTEQERVAAATDLFGAKVAEELTPFLNQGAEGIKAMYDEAEQYGMVMSNDAVKASAAFNDSITKLRGTAAGIKNMFIGELLPGITGITDGLSEIFRGDFDAGAEMISNAVEELVEKITELLPRLMELGGAILTAIVNAIGANLPKLTQAAVPIVMELAGAIIKNLPEIVRAAVACIKELARGLMDNTDEIVAATVEIIGVLTEGLVELLPELTEAGIELILGLIAGLSDAGVIGQLLQAGIQLVGRLVETIISCVPDLLDAGWQLIKGLWDGISNAAGWLWDMLKSLGATLVSTVKGIFKIKSPSGVFRDEIGAQLMRGIAKGITDFTPEAQEALRRATDSLHGTAEMSYRIDGIAGQVAAANEAVAYTGTYSAARDDRMDAVIELLERVVAGEKTAVFTPDGQFAGWIDRQMGDRVRLARRFS